MLLDILKDGVELGKVDTNVVEYPGKAYLTIGLLEDSKDES